MRSFILAISFIFAGLQAFSQIVITRNDMPFVGDTIRISTTTNIPGFEPDATGPDFTWDFSSLTAQNQSVERYVSINSTPPFYQIIFNSTVANLASPVEMIDFVPGFEISDAYVYYMATNASYVRPGYAATIMGIPVPMKFDQPERIYSFPLQYTSQPDSSTSSYSLGIPGMGYFSIMRKRVNHVDGWGSLTTPLGSFDVLRVKSSIYEYDSLYIDSLQMGFPVIRHYTEYQWLGTGHDVPLLSITEENGMFAARYKDIIQNFDPMVLIPDPDQLVCKGESLTIGVSVSGGTPPYEFFWSTGQTTQSITVEPDSTTTYEVFVSDAAGTWQTASITIEVIPFEHLTLGNDTVICAYESITFSSPHFYEAIRWYVNGTMVSADGTFTLDSTGVGLGVALVRAEFEQGQCSGFDECSVQFEICEGINEENINALRIYPNPASEILRIETGVFKREISYSIATGSGNVVLKSGNIQNNGFLEPEISLLRPGIYLIRVTDGNTHGAAVFIKN